MRKVHNNGGRVKIFIAILLLIVGCSQQPAGYAPSTEERKKQNICKGKLKKEIIDRYDKCLVKEAKGIFYVDPRRNCKANAIEFICPMGSLEGLSDD